jgi:glycine/D-amino acid oxidase-like deaminating enzyme
MLYDFVIVGAGIAGSSIAYFLKSKKVLVIDKSGICQKASNAAGAFLFPKVGFNTKYTKFVNDALLFSFDFYEKLGINTHKDGVVILPRDDRDIKKFKEYQKTFQITYKSQNGGFFFEDGGFVDSQKTCNILLQDIEFKELTITKVEKKDIFILNDTIKTKNLILATGWETIIDIPYIKIRPVWGQRIEIKTSVNPEFNYHKNCSLSKNQDGIVKIGATHERRWSDKNPDEENSNILLQKANEILQINDAKVYSMKSGMRAGSIDYFPIAGKIIDTQKTLTKYPEITKGRIPKDIFYIEGLYIINGGGGRGFSNYIYVAKMLSKYILDNIPLPKEIDTKRLFIKWARKL